MRNCPFCAGPIDESERVRSLYASGKTPTGAAYDIRDAVTFTVANIGTLTVVWQFIVGLIAAWRKPTIARLLVVLLPLTLVGCQFSAALIKSLPGAPAPTPSPVPTPGPTPLPQPTPIPTPVPVPTPVPGPELGAYPRKVAQVRIKVHTPAVERADGRALMDGVALACGTNPDFPARQCWPACGPEDYEGRRDCDTSMLVYWIGGLAHRSNPWLRHAARGESVRACVGAEATAAGSDVCSEAVEGR